MGRWIWRVLPLLFLPGAALAFETATAETTADAAAHAGKLVGTAEILEASKPGDAILLRFRVALIESWTVQKAVVAVHQPRGAAVPAAIIVAAVSAPWNERLADPPAIPPGLSVPTRSLEQDWFSFELPAAVARQLASGAASSVAISVAEGKMIRIHSRRTGQFMPYLLVRGVPGGIAVKH